jgi:hypothetical protein
MPTQTSRWGRESEQGKSVGRARITLEDLDPNWREIMLQVFAEGGSDAEAKVALGIPTIRSSVNRLGFMSVPPQRWRTRLIFGGVCVARVKVVVPDICLQ